uniref:C-type lectin TC14-4 n=1 Tax=Polyandrocarpa misakiensis TaxID=7723 RepID=Q9GUX9_POLMI|nr:C-type lectin TC14-4 [Polyandrocarpa misakiensis]
MIHGAILIAFLACGIPASYAGNYEILIADRSMNYANAKAFCDCKGMRLAAASLRDADTSQDILAYTASSGYNYWVGADNLQNGGYDFLWSDGVALPASSNLWAPKEPSNPQSSQLCVQLWNKYNMLDDTSCGDAKRVICEKEVK